MFLPTTTQELKKLGWVQPDVILVTGDVYIDSCYDGIAVIGQVLLKAGYKVAVIAQPDVNSDTDITRLGEPALFWGVSGGCVDSMVANYTALKKKKRNDDLTPEGINNRRPDRAVIAYTNLIKKYFKNKKPVVIGGVEASLRRIAHYDYWSDSIRRSVLFDSKADVLIYGMGEKTIIELADCFKNQDDFRSIRGICYASNEVPAEYIELPSFEEVKRDKFKFIEMFHEFYKNNDPLNALGLAQRQDTRYLIQNPPNYNPSPHELDEIYNIVFERDVHPFYKKMGKVKALDTIQFSINSHRGCYGECNFCSITVHQGRTIVSRSQESILNEAKQITAHKDFKGIISDIGGPTANMYENYCKKQLTSGSCKDQRCAFPDICKAMRYDHSSQVDLLNKLRDIPGVRKVFVGSGVRYDLVVEDKKSGENYFYEIVQNHVSGQMKIAPEHYEQKVLDKMGKPSKKTLLRFKDDFYSITKKAEKNQFLTYYFIAAHPGCEMEDMKKLNSFIKSELKLHPEQVQIFTPTPSTYSTLMYYTGLDPWTLEKIPIEKDLKRKQSQKEIIVK